tara:strand:- start:322 stop:534 length:213 start_codon:yes stop_codon:yes gene_type:complete
MTEKCEEMWQPTDEQVNKIILPAMQGIAQQCAGYINELQCPPEFISVMLRDVADAFEAPVPEAEGDCSCC